MVLCSAIGEGAGGIGGGAGMVDITGGTWEEEECVKKIKRRKDDEFLPQALLELGLLRRHFLCADACEIFEYQQRVFPQSLLSDILVFSQSFLSEPEKQQQQHGEEEEEDGEGADDDSKQSLQTCWAGARRAGSNLISVYKLLSLWSYNLTWVFLQKSWFSFEPILTECLLPKVQMMMSLRL